MHGDGASFCSSQLDHISMNESTSDRNNRSLFTSAMLAYPTVDRKTFR
jgi:hypothetical protein